MLVQNNNTPGVILALIIICMCGIFGTMLTTQQFGPIVDIPSATRNIDPIALPKHLWAVFAIITIGSVSLLGYAYRRGSTKVNYSSDIKIVNAHTISFATSWGGFQDRLDVFVDQDLVMSNFASSWQSLFHGESLYRFEIDHQQVIIRWKWSQWGDPLYILLESRGNILAKYGNEKNLKKIGNSLSKNVLEAKSLIRSRLLKDKDCTDSVSTFDSEEYLLDNRHGSESMTVEQEISKTTTNNLTIEEGALNKLDMTAGITSVIKGQIAKDLSEQIGVVVGQTVSKRHTFRFSVSPGDAVIYTIVWKNRVRNGTYNFLINQENVTFPYQVQYDLLYGISSKRAPNAGKRGNKNK
jgi:hypothetical protein